MHHGRLIRNWTGKGGTGSPTEAKNKLVSDIFESTLQGAPEQTDVSGDSGGEVASACSRTWELGSRGKWRGGLERQLPEEKTRSQKLTPTRKTNHQAGGPGSKCPLPNGTGEQDT